MVALPPCSPLPVGAEGSVSLVSQSEKKKKSRLHNPFKKRHWAQFSVCISGGNIPLASSPSPSRRRRG